MQLDKMAEIPTADSVIKDVEFGEHVSDLIGDRYKDWKVSDVVFISASTGLGKTFWVMNDLYEYARERDEEIAIILNRRILKDQVWEDARRYEWERYRDRVGVHIFSYQQIEAAGDYDYDNPIKLAIRRCRYIVCDECHYFLSDALFNQGTQASFDFLTQQYRVSTLIFVSATIERVREPIKQKILEIYNKRFVEWNETMDEEWAYDQSGKQRGLAEYAEIVEENGGYFKTHEECETIGGGPSVPHERLFSFHRNIDRNIKVRHFRTIEDLPELIKNGNYKGKWLIFVADKKKGRDLAKTIGGNTVYVDADLLEQMAAEWNKDNPAYKEINGIRHHGKFGCDVLVTTSVLDNGVNIKDPDVKNMVLMTDDEVEFKQMLGRKRFLSGDEVINVFISCGDRKSFTDRARMYYNIYWQLCDKPNLSPSEALRFAASDGFNKISYYNENELGWFTVNELTKRAVWMRGMYCNRMAGEMLADENAFLRKQSEWLGMDYTEEWKEKESVSVSQEEVDRVADILSKTYERWLLFDKNVLDQIWGEIFPVVSKIVPQEYENGGSVKITTINGALESRSEWSGYQIAPFAGKFRDNQSFTVYELIYQGKSRRDIDSGITLEQLKELLENDGVGIKAVVDFLFGAVMEITYGNNTDDTEAADTGNTDENGIESRDEELMKKYANKRMLESEYLMAVFLKISGGKITAVKRT